MNHRKSLLERIEVLYEDPDVVVIEKASGVLSYPIPNDSTEGAIQLIRRYWKARNLQNTHLYLLHRLDKETSGLMVFAKSSLARKELLRQFEAHSILRGYAAVCSGIPRKDEGSIRTLLARNPHGRRSVAPVGKTAITFYRVAAKNDSRQHALIRCTLHTGRTHQVRIHLAHIGSPVIGDRVYGKKRFDRLALHAEILGFVHPRTGKPIVFYSSLPEDLKKLL
jgi:23S rRNA pseudouridine1911/1915/1917 synthase